MKAKLVTHPLSIGINASSDVFRYYSSGVLTTSDGCPTSSINHVVVIVGYSQSGNYWKVQN